MFGLRSKRIVEWLVIFGVVYLVFKALKKVVLKIIYYSEIGLKIAELLK